MDADEALKALSTPWHNQRISRYTRSAGPTPSGGVVLDDPDKGGFRFTKSSKEYKFLESLFKSNSVKASDRPSAFKARFDIFDKIKSDSFRNKFNDLKKEYKLGTKTGKKSIVLILTKDNGVLDTLTFPLLTTRCCATQGRYA